jgi:hypothetical protein
MLLTLIPQLRLTRQNGRADMDTILVADAPFESFGALVSAAHADADGLPHPVILAAPLEHGGERAWRDQFLRSWSLQGISEDSEQTLPRRLRRRRPSSVATELDLSALIDPTYLIPEYVLHKRVYRATMTYPGLIGRPDLKDKYADFIHNFGLFTQLKQAMGACERHEAELFGGHEGIKEWHLDRHDSTHRPVYYAYHSNSLHLVEALDVEADTPTIGAAMDEDSRVTRDRQAVQEITLSMAHTEQPGGTGRRRTSSAAVSFDWPRTCPALTRRCCCSPGVLRPDQL